MESIKNDYLKNQQIIASRNTDEITIQRKTLAHNYSVANKLLDEASNGYLIEKGMRSLYKSLDEAPKNNENSIREALSSYNIKAPISMKTALNTSIDKMEMSTCTCPENNFTAAEIQKVVNAYEPKTLPKEPASFSKKNNAKDSARLAPLHQEKPPKINLPAPSKVESGPFKTAFEELQTRNGKKNTANPNPVQKRTLGIRRKVNSKFVSPLLSSHDSSEEPTEESSSATDNHLKSVDKKMIEMIRNEIMDVGSSIGWDDIAGLEFAKNAIQEAVVWPMLRPDIFKGLRKPPKGILLFGPPGTGKTLIGKCIASQSKSTFFSISASTLTSKWVGEGEKMVRALFGVARSHQPAVIFIDEIDSLLSQRSETEHESSRRMKTEFLVQLDGATTDSEERLLLIGATNRPQELDEAARRRFVKRLHIPLPNFEARLQLVSRLISNEKHDLNQGNLEEIARKSDGYSGADLKSLCSEASLGPIRSIGIAMIEKIQADEVRPLQMEDFENAFMRVRSSVSAKDLDQYVTWDRTYGAGC